VKLAFWSWALVNMLLVVAFALAGVRHARAGRFGSHRRRMLAAGAFVALFLGCYAAKVLLFGREDRASWSQSALWTLYLHEACVAVMLLAAGTAATLARPFAGIRDGEPAALRASARRRRLHRRAGGAAVTAGLLATLTAACVLFGMFTRAGV